MTLENSGNMASEVILSKRQQTNRLSRRCFIATGVAANVAVTWLPSFAADRANLKVSRFWVADGMPLTLDRWMPNPTTPFEGKIIDISDRELLYIPKSGESERRMQGDQVIAVDVAWDTDIAAKSHNLFRERKYVESIQAAEQGVQSGIQQWQQRLLFAEMADAYRNLGRFAESGLFFLTLIKHSPPTFLYASMPLVWTRTDLDKKALDSAQDWIEQDTEASKLLGASWLLTGADRSKAESILRSLSQSKKPVIAQLATAQLWRTVPATEGISQKQIQWQTIRNKMLLPIQVGPTEVIADKLDQAGNAQQAVPEWLRIAIVHRDRYDAASRAIARAAKAKRDAGQEAEAKRIEELLQTLP
jgi:tetratricopeptide (TPR) repeat protein